MRSVLRMLFFLAAPALCQAAAEMTATPSGLRYAITEHGAGPAPSAGQVVLAHYVGTLPDGTVFDSSRERKEPFAFTLGKHQVIKGWDEGFALLHVGDEATLVIPPELAYGAKRRGPIPPNSTLRFEVELVGLKDSSLSDILGEVIDSTGVGEAQKRYDQLKASGLGGIFASEAQLNAMGYRYLMKGKVPEGVAVLRWSTELFPGSANAFDFLGEAYVRLGDRALAISSYKKSLALDPKNQNAERYLEALQTAGDGSVALTQMREKLEIEMEIDDAFEAWSAGKSVDLAGLRASLVAYIGKPAASGVGFDLVRNYLYLAEAADLKQAASDWAFFRESPDPRIRALAETKLRFAQELSAPIELKFTAIDGREVDLAKLRGKVVLLDFWATWCPPCRAELPNVKRVYQAYHDKGLEIVGISQDRAGDLQKLKDFVAREGMPWPQNYEGRKHNEGGNTLAARFAVTGIPAMMLLDKSGRIVSLNALGPRLETGVRSLLGLP